MRTPVLLQWQSFPCAFQLPAKVTMLPAARSQADPLDARVGSCSKSKVLAEVAPSPDGNRRVAFAVSSAVMELAKKSEWLSQVYLGNTDGSQTVQLTRGEKSATNPAWSPDGLWIAFLTPRAGPKSNLWRIPVGGWRGQRATDRRKRRNHRLLVVARRFADRLS